MCRVLVNEGASLTAVDYYGQTPLEFAKAHRKAACITILETAAQDAEQEATKAAEISAAELSPTQTAESEKASDEAKP